MRAAIRERRRADNCPSPASKTAAACRGNPGRAELARPSGRYSASCGGSRRSGFLLVPGAGCAGGRRKGRKVSNRARSGRFSGAKPEPGRERRKTRLPSLLSGPGFRGVLRGSVRLRVGLNVAREICDQSSFANVTRDHQNGNDTPRVRGISDDGTLLSPCRATVPHSGFGDGDAELPGGPALGVDAEVVLSGSNFAKASRRNSFRSQSQSRTPVPTNRRTIWL